MKILIVDDEMAVHDQLKRCIALNASDWNIVGDAFNGEEACRLVEICEPDIVISDIKMPLLDGLSFMEWLKNNDFAGRVIVLSGYGDFQYSRPAFLLDAFEYLLKPLKETELYMALSKAAEQMQLATRQKTDQINEKAVLNQGLVLMKDEFLSLIISGSIKDEHEIIVRADQFSLALPETQYYLILVKLIELDEKIDERYEGDRSIFYFAARNILEECLQGQKGTVFRNQQRSNEFILICPANEMKAIDLPKRVQNIHLSLTACLRVKAIYGISLLKQRLNAIPNAYLEAVHAIDTIRFGSREYLACFGQESQVEHAMENSKEWKEMNELLECLLETGSLHNGQNLISKLHEALHENALAKMSMLDIKKAVSELLTKIEKAALQSEGMTLLVQEVKISMSELNVSRVEHALNEIMDLLLKSVTNDHKSKSGKQLIQVIKQYSEENFRTVNLDEISQRFYLNKNYFCSLFKSVTNENFSDFLVKIRVEQAKLLLMNSELKTYEIAVMVGYQDQRYFSQVFRKIAGMQPTQYRKAYQGAKHAET